MISAATEARICLVCATPTNAAHFGKDTCRACAAFFKRTKVSGKIYCCQSGDGKCDVTMKATTPCRCCRYDKCLAVGLVYEGPLRPYKKPIDDTLLPIPDNARSEKAANPLNQALVSGETLLHRIGREFNSSVERRRVFERIFLRNCPEVVRMEHPTEEMYVTSYDTSLRMYDYVIADTWEVFKTLFPSLKSLNALDQKHLFCLFLPKFSLVESHYRTIKIWGNVGEFYMPSVLICIDLRNPRSWVGRNDGGANRESLIQSITQYQKEQSEILVPVLNRIQMTATEFNASLALLLCDCDVADSVAPVLRELQEEALDELQRYYKDELGLVDFSSRLGNLMSLTHTMRESAALFMEFFDTQRALFDVYCATEMFMNLSL